MTHDTVTIRDVDAQFAMNLADFLEESSFNMEVCEENPRDPDDELQAFIDQLRRA